MRAWWQMWLAAGSQKRMMLRFCVRGRCAVPSLSGELSWSFSGPETLGVRPDAVALDGPFFSVCCSLTMGFYPCLTLLSAHRFHLAISSVCTASHQVKALDLKRSLGRWPKSLTPQL